MSYVLSFVTDCSKSYVCCRTPLSSGSVSSIRLHIKCKICLARVCLFWKECKRRSTSPKSPSSSLRGILSASQKWKLNFPRKWTEDEESLIYFWEELLQIPRFWCALLLMKLCNHARFLGQFKCSEARTRLYITVEGAWFGNVANSRWTLALLQFADGECVHLCWQWRFQGWRRSKKCVC